MYLQIYNKNNLIDETKPISQRYLTTNLKQFPIADGSVYKKNFNETLDSFVSKIGNQPLQIDIEPYDEVLITDNSIKSVFGLAKSCRMLVDSYNEHLVSINPKIYNYEINLFSKTKLLEGAICPNLSITPERTGIRRTIWQYVIEYMNLYCPQHRRLGGVFYKIINLPSSQSQLALKLNVECPEKQWNNPTLREVLNDLFMVVDCIPIVNSNNELDYLDLTEIKNDITNDININRIEKSQSSENYVSELYMNMQNVMQTKVDKINNSIITTERFTFGSPNYIVNANNFILKTQNPIQEINHLYMYNIGWMGVPDTTPDVFASSNNMFLSKTDICNIGGYSFVKEKDEYDSLKVCYRVSDLPADLEGKSNTQNCCIYFKRYGNEISGFSKETKNAPFIVFETGVTNTLYLLKELAQKYIETPNNIYYEGKLQSDENSNNFLFTFFEIEYKTTSETVFRAGKKDIKNDKIVIDNQTNSFVDAFTQGNLEYQKANRLGNAILSINQRVKQNDVNAHLIDIGDYYIDNKGKYIIYAVEYQIYNDFIEVNAIATKDYVLKNYFTGINSKIRTWVNAKDEALIRHDLLKIYCELSTKSAMDDFDNKNIHNVSFDIERILSPLLKYNINPIKKAFIHTIYEENYLNKQLPSDGEDYEVELSTKLVGESIVLTTGFKDNYNVAVSPDYDLIFPNKQFNNVEFSAMLSGVDKYFAPSLKASFLNSYGGTPYQNRKYTNEIGRFDKISIKLGNVKNNVTYNPGTFSNAKIISKIAVSNNQYQYVCDMLDYNGDAQRLNYALTNAPNSIFVYHKGNKYKHNLDVIVDYVDSTTFTITTELNFDLLDGITLYPTEITPGHAFDGKQETLNWIYDSFKKPIIDYAQEGDLLLSTTISRRKDNKDITRQSIQLEYITNEDSIYITNEFIKHSSIIREETSDIKIYSSNTYIKGTITLPQDALEVDVDITINGRKATINDLNNPLCYYITRDDKVILGTRNKEFYIRTKYIKNDYIYNFDGQIIDVL